VKRATAAGHRSQMRGQPASNACEFDVIPVGRSRLIRVWFTVVAAATLCVWFSAEAARGAQREVSRTSLISLVLLSPIPVPRGDDGDPLVTVSLAFTVSVCLADVEFSFACWERGLAEAARRLEQIYLDDYVMRRAAGSLRVWFTLATERSEQLRFLREAEERAINSVTAKLQTDSGQGIISQMISPGMNLPITNPREESGEPGGSERKGGQPLQKWREDANLEARKGTNWLHDWSSRTHSYQLGPALHELAHIRTDQSSN
jgi:hypothetical protein